MAEKKIYEACRRLLTICANCQPEENILIVTDTDSLEIGMALWDAAEEFPNKTMVMMEPRKMHGEEPTALVAAAMLKADVIFRATKFSLSYSIEPHIPTHRAILLAHHGALTWGKDLTEAWFRMESLEQTAKTYLCCQTLLGNRNMLTEEEAQELAAVRERLWE